MNYNDMPLIIPILATGYLLAVYLLLVLAERSARDLSSKVISASKNQHKQEPAPVPPQVREVSSVR